MNLSPLIETTCVTSMPSRKALGWHGLGWLHRVPLVCQCWIATVMRELGEGAPTVLGKEVDSRAKPKFGTNDQHANHHSAAGWLRFTQHNTATIAPSLHQRLVSLPSSIPTAQIPQQRQQAADEEWQGSLAAYLIFGALIVVSPWRCTTLLTFPSSSFTNSTLAFTTRHSNSVFDVGKIGNFG